MKHRPSTIIIGIGNPLRGDDGAGLQVSRHLKDKSPPGIRIEESSGEITELMDLWEGFEEVVAVDALSSGGTPGEVLRYEVHHNPLPAETFRYSTHGLSLADAIELARAMDRLPPRLIVFAIEGRDFSAGEELSPQVAKACEHVAEQILRELALE